MRGERKPTPGDTRARAAGSATALQLHRHGVCATPRPPPVRRGRRRSRGSNRQPRGRGKPVPGRKSDASAALAAATATLKAQIDELAERRETWHEATLDPELVARRERAAAACRRGRPLAPGATGSPLQFNASNVREVNGRRRRLDGIASETSAWESRRQQAATRR